MATQKNNLDDLSLDNFDSFGLEDPTQTNQPKSSDTKREAITKISTSFAQGAKEVLTDSDQIRRFAAGALPEGYGTTINTGFEFSKDVRGLYNEAVEELRPAMPFIRRVAGKVSEVKGILPEGLRKKLKEVAESKDPDSFIQTQQMQDSQLMTNELTALFGDQMQQQSIQYQETANRALISDQVQMKQNQTLAQLMEMVRANTARQVAFQDQLTSRYMKKSLELQYRQYFATRDMLNIAIRRERSDTEFFKNIMRNTGLPDYVKLPLNEAAASNFRDRLLGYGQKTAARFVSDFSGNLVKNLRGSMKNAISGLVSGAQMGEMAMDSAEQQAQMEKELEELGMASETRGQKMGKQAGSMITDFALPFLANPVRKLLNRSTKLRRGGAKAGMFTDVIAERMNEWAQSDTNSSGWFAPLIWMLKDVVPKFNLDKSLGDAAIVGADKPVPFDSLTRRSIVEIIPGYLSRILREITVLRTGDEKTEAITYNLDRGEFTTKTQAAKDAARRLFSPADSRALQGQLGNVLSMLGGDKMTEKQREELSRQMTRDAASGRAFSVKRYTDGESNTQDLSYESKAALQAIFGDALKGDNKTLREEKELQVMRAFRQLQNYYKDPRGAMSVYRDTGNRELLQMLGVIDRMGFSDRVNYDVANNIMLGQLKNEYTPEGTVEGGGAVKRNNWTPGGLNGKDAADKFGNSVVAGVDKITEAAMKAKEALQKLDMKAFKGLKGAALEKAVAAKKAAQNLGAGELVDQFNRLSDQGKKKIAAIVARASMIKVDANDLNGGVAQEIFDALPPQARTEVESVIVNEGIGSKVEMGPAPAPSSPLFAAARESAPRTTPVVGPSGESGSGSVQLSSEALDRLVGIGQEQAEVQKAILDALLNLDFGGGGGGEGGDKPKQRKFFSSVFNKLWSGTRKAGSAYAKYAGFVLRSPFMAAGAAGRVGLDLAKGIFGKAVNDIYVVGETEPVLKKKKLLKGDYRDINTKKPIRYIKDIRNPIIDVTEKDSAPVVTEDMIQKGFYTIQDGKPSVVRRLAGTAGSVLATVAGAYGQMFKLPFMLTGGAARLANGMMKKLFDGRKDVYVRGQTTGEPILRAIHMDGRHYFTDKGKGVTHIKQLDGKTVIFAKDRETILIGAEEYDKGLVDARGRPLKTYASRLAGAAMGLAAGVIGGTAALIGGAARGFGKFVGGGYSLMGGIGGGIMRKIGGAFGFGKNRGGVDSQATEVLISIHDMLDQRLPGKKFRKGSWQERFANREKEKEKKEESKEQKKGVDLLGQLGKLFSKGAKSLGALFGFGDDEEEGGGGGGTTIINGGGGDKEGKEGKGKGKGGKAAPAKPKGKLARLWGATGGRLFGGGKGAAAGKAAGAAGAAGAAKKAGRFRGFSKGALITSLLASVGLSALSDKVPGGVMDAVDTGLTGWSLWSMLGLGGGGAAAGGATAAGGAAAAGGATAAAGGAAAAGTAAAGTAAAGTAAAGTAAAAGGATAAGGIGTAAAGAGGLGLAATIGIPLAIAAVAGYGIYKGYKSYKYSGFTPLRGYRMTQYGINFMEPSDVEKIIDLESMLEQTVTSMNGGLDLESGKIKMEDVYKMFGIDDGWFSNNSDERKMFDAWFNGRFKPVYLRWIAELRTIKPGTALNEAEDKLKPEEQQKLLRAVRGIDSGVYALKAGPFGDLTDITGDRVQEVYIRAEREVKDMVEGKGGFMRGARKLNQALLGTNIFGGKYILQMSDWMEEKRGEIFNDNSKEGIAKLIGDVGGDRTAGGEGGYGAITISAAASVGMSGSGTLSAFQGLRLRAYGLIEMDKERVQLLLKMERDLLDKTTVSPNNPAQINVNLSDAWKTYGPSFGQNESDTKAKERWVAWFQYRFVAVVATYATKAAELLRSSDMTNLDGRLKGMQKYEVGVAITQAKTDNGYNMPIWKVYFSPWDPAERLNTDVSTTHGVLVTLKEGLKSEPLGEERAQGQDTKVKMAQDKLDALTSGGKVQEKGWWDRTKAWFTGDSASGTKSLWGRAKEGATAVMDNLSEANSQLRQGNFTNAATAVANAATAPGRYIAGQGAGPEAKLDIKGTAKEREAQVIKEAIAAGITNPNELAMMLGQMAAETGKFSNLVESLRYRPEQAKKTWPKRFRDAAHAAQILAQGPEAFAEFVYGNRRDLGNTQPGDGYRFRGRGLMQLTGRANYAAFARWSGIDVLSNPDQVATDPRIAAKSAVFWWMNRGRGLRQLAQQGDLGRVTQLVNGGQTGLEHRRAYFNQYLAKFQNKTIEQIAAEAGSNAPAAPAAGAKADFSDVTGSVSSTAAKSGAKPGAAAAAAAPAAGGPVAAQTTIPGGPGAGSAAVGGTGGSSGGLSAAVAATAPTASASGAPTMASPNAIAGIGQQAAPSAAQYEQYRQADVASSQSRQNSAAANEGTARMVDLMTQQLDVQKKMLEELVRIAGTSQKQEDRMVQAKREADREALKPQPAPTSPQAQAQAQQTMTPTQAAVAAGMSASPPEMTSKTPINVRRQITING